MFRLAAPLAAGMLLHALYNVVDAYWLGKLSEEALAAPGASRPIFFLVFALGMGFGTGGAALVAQYTGARRHREADRAAAQTLLLLSVVAAAVAAPLIVFAPRVFRLCLVPADTLPYAVTYLRIIMFGMPFMAFQIAYGSILRGLGDTITVVVIGVFANVVNLVLDPFLIFGWAGAPRLGVGGAALASVTSRILAAGACYVCLRRGRAGLHITLADLKPDWPMLRKTVGIGLPVVVGHGSNSVGFLFFQAMVNRLGTTVMGAFMVGFSVIHFFAVPGRAMAMAAAPVVGQSLGAGKPKLARRAVWSSAALVALITFIPLALLMLKGQAIARAFRDDANFVAETGKFFLVVPASSYFWNVLMVLMAAFYGSGHTRPAMVVAIIRLWLLRLPAAYLLAFVLGWGSIGIYAGMVIGNVVCAGIALWLFMGGGWQSAVVPTKEPEPSYADSRQQPGSASQ